MLKLACVLLLCMTGAFAADVSGAWQVSVHTGTFHSQIFGDAPLTGSVKGNTIEFAFEGDAQGQKLKVTYKGTIESPTVMKGAAVYGGIDDKAVWSATKK